jgi:hypothetical protein
MFLQQLNLRDKKLKQALLELKQARDQAAKRADAEKRVKDKDSVRLYLFWQIAGVLPLGLLGPHRPVQNSWLHANGTLGPHPLNMHR